MENGSLHYDPATDIPPQCNVCDKPILDGQQSVIVNGGDAHRYCLEDEYTSRCPACGEPIDYCQGHGETGDPAGFATLAAHDDEDHSDCNPRGCEEAEREQRLQGADPFDRPSPATHPEYWTE